MRLYQLFDTKAHTPLGPIVRHYRDEAAVRQFFDIIEASDTLPNKYPDDFVLLYIGDQDTESGAITYIPTVPQIIQKGRNNA